MKRIISLAFFLLYLLFLGNANLYAYVSLTPSLTSCCSEEETSCCSSSSSKETPNSESNCCQGNGCCSWQENRIPTSLDCSRVNQEISTEKFSQKKSVQKFNKSKFYTIDFYCISEESYKIFIYPLRDLIEDRQSRFSIWRC